jgi:hypothetical protein
MPYDNYKIMPENDHLAKFDYSERDSEPICSMPSDIIEATVPGNRGSDLLVEFLAGADSKGIEVQFYFAFSAIQAAWRLEWFRA